MVAFSQTNVPKVHSTVSFHIISLLLSETRRELVLGQTLFGYFTTEILRLSSLLQRLLLTYTWNRHKSLSIVQGGP